MYSQSDQSGRQQQFFQHLQQLHQLQQQQLQQLQHDLQQLQKQQQEATQSDSQRSQSQPRQVPITSDPSGPQSEPAQHASPTQQPPPQGQQPPQPEYQQPPQQSQPPQQDQQQPPQQEPQPQQEQQPPQQHQQPPPSEPQAPPQPTQPTQSQHPQSHPERANRRGWRRFSPWRRSPGGQQTHAVPEALPTAIESIARRDVVTAEPTTSVADLADLMVDEDVGSVVIVEEDEPVGISTDRDLVYVFASEQDPSELTARDIMADVVTVSADGSVSEVIQRMGEARVRRMPIVDEDNELVGIVSFDDFVQLFATELGNLASVIDDTTSR